MNRLRCCMPVSPDSASNSNATAQPTPAEVERRDQAAPGKGPDRRLSRVDRRAGAERRHATAEQEAAYPGTELRTKAGGRVYAGIKRRGGPGRRLADDR